MERPDLKDAAGGVVTRSFVGTLWKGGIERADESSSLSERVEHLSRLRRTGEIA